MTKIYRAERGLRPAVFVVDANGVRPLPQRLDLRNHSPTGFEWGYGGSGPAQLALAILADALDNDGDALRFYQDFKAQVIARLPRDKFELRAPAVVKWAARTATAHPPARAFLSPTMREAVERAEEHGGFLHRLPGGFWTWRGCAMVNGYPDWYANSSTVQALVRRGCAHYVEWQIGRNVFPISVRIDLDYVAPQSVRAGDDAPAPIEQPPYLFAGLDLAAKGSEPSIVTMCSCGQRSLCARSDCAFRSGT